MEGFSLHTTCSICMGLIATEQLTQILLKTQYPVVAMHILLSCLHKHRASLVNLEWNVFWSCQEMKR